MRDDVPKDLLGYVVVSLPDAAHWQGFFVAPQLATAGERMLGQVRRSVGDAPPPGMSPRDPRGGYRSRVRRFEVADVDEARETMVTEITRARRMRDLGESLMRDVRNAQDRRRGGR